MYVHTGMLIPCTIYSSHGQTNISGKLPCEMSYTLLNPVVLHRRSLRALSEGSSA